MKNLLILLSLIICACSASGANEEAFLNQVKGQTVYDTKELKTQRGQFSADGREFTFTGGTVPMVIHKALNDNSAYYVERMGGVSTRMTITIEGKDVTFAEQNGQKPFILYLS